MEKHHEKKSSMPEVLIIEKPEPPKRRTKAYTERYDYIAALPVNGGFQVTNEEFKSKWRRTIKDYTAENSGAAFSFMAYQGGTLVYRDA